MATGEMQLVARGAMMDVILLIHRPQQGLVESS